MFQSQNTTVIVTQPRPLQPVAAAVYVIPPPNYAGLAWFSCLCCVWPIGLFAVIKSFEVSQAQKFAKVPPPVWAYVLYNNIFIINQQGQCPNFIPIRFEKKSFHLLTLEKPMLSFLSKDRVHTTQGKPEKTPIFKKTSRKLRELF